MKQKVALLFFLIQGAILTVVFGAGETNSSSMPSSSSTTQMATAGYNATPITATATIAAIATMDTATTITAATTMDNATKIAAATTMENTTAIAATTTMDSATTQTAGTEAAVTSATTSAASSVKLSTGLQILSTVFILLPPLLLVMNRSSGEKLKVG